MNTLQRIHDFITEALYNIEPYMSVNFGRGQDINWFADTSDLLLWILPITVSSRQSGNNNLQLIETAQVNVFVFGKDKMSNDNAETFDIIKSAYDTATLLSIEMLNIQDNQYLFCRNFRKVSEYKYSAKNLYSGVLMSFEIEIADNYDYCTNS
jgi:hypothetical protein